MDLPLRQTKPLSTSSVEHSALQAPPRLERTILTNRLRPLLPKVPSTGRLPRLPFIVKRKPSPTVLLEPISNSHSSLTAGRCGIRACQLRRCTLASHRRFVDDFLRRSITASRNDSSADGTPNHDLTATNLPWLDLLGISTPVLLPIDGLEEYQPQFQQLFRIFFSKTVWRVHALLVPPGPKSLTWTHERQQELYQNGTLVTADCFNFIGTAYNVLCANAPGLEPFPETTGLVIQHQLIQRLREILDAYDPEKHAERVISIIFTLVTAELVISRAASVSAHRQAMVRVIDSCGGIHHTGNATQLALTLDRLLAVLLSSAPLYTSWQQVSLPIQRAPKYTTVYGSFFDHQNSTKGLNQHITQYCREVCRAVEILEGESWDFTGKNEAYSQEIYFMYYLRDRLTSKFAHLNARADAQHPCEQCILQAAKIVEYVTLLDNYIPAFTSVMAERIQSILVTHKVDSTWINWEKVLLWVSFVLVCMPVKWDGESWADNFCQLMLRRTYGKDWLNVCAWKKNTLTTLRSFVWSATRFDEAFEAYIDQLGNSYNTET